jgi:hypothetical protein
MLLAQLDLRAFSRARAKTGNKIAARRAMMAMTTKSSINVKPDLRVTALSDLKNLTRDILIPLRKFLENRRAPEFLWLPQESQKYCRQMLITQS